MVIRRGGQALWLRVFFRFLDGSFGRLKAHLAMGSVAKRLIDRSPATAQRERRFARQIVFVSVSIHQFNRTFRGFNSIRTVFPDSNFDRRHASSNGMRATKTRNCAVVLPTGRSIGPVSVTTPTA